MQWQNYNINLDAVVPAPALSLPQPMGAEDAKVPFQGPLPRAYLRGACPFLHLPSKPSDTPECKTLNIDFQQVRSGDF